MPVLSKNEKTFEYYFDLPVELRIMVVGEMISNDRCRFRRCSRSSDKEVKATKNACYELTFEAFIKSDFCIDVAYGKEDIISYSLNFVEEKRKKYMRYLDVKQKELWKMELDSSTDLPLYAADQFKALLRLYQNKIRKLDIFGSLFEDKLRAYDFGIKNLRNVEELHMNGNTENLQYLSKLRCPLKEFFASSVENDRILTDCHEVYQVQNFLIMPNTKFTKEEFLRISATHVRISIGDLTEMDICHFIRLWQNRIIGRKRVCYTWRMSKDLNWDIPKLLRLLEIECDFDEERSFEAELFNESKNRAKIRYIVDDDDYHKDFNHLVFEVDYNPERIAWIETL